MISVAPDNLSILEYSDSIIEEQCYQLSCQGQNFSDSQVAR